MINEALQELMALYSSISAIMADETCNNCIENQCDYIVYSLGTFLAKLGKSCITFMRTRLRGADYTGDQGGREVKYRGESISYTRHV